jgi:hypothetical protein
VAVRPRIGSALLEKQETVLSMVQDALAPLVTLPELSKPIIVFDSFYSTRGVREWLSSHDFRFMGSTKVKNTEWVGEAMQKLVRCFAVKILDLLTFDATG